MFFHVLVGHLYVFFGKMTIWIICSFLKIGLWFFIHFLTSELYVVVQLLGRVWLFSDPTDCSPLGSSIWGILEWVAISFSSGSSRPRDQAYVSHVSWISRWILYHWATREELYELFIYSESSTPYQIYILPTLPLIQQVPFSFIDGFPSLYSGFFFFLCSPSHLFFLVFFGVKSKEITKTMLRRLLSTSSLRSYMVSGLTFISLIHFELIFYVYYTKDHAAIRKIWKLNQ